MWALRRALEAVPWESQDGRRLERARGEVRQVRFRYALGPVQARFRSSPGTVQVLRRLHRGAGRAFRRQHGQADAAAGLSADEPCC